MNSKTDSFLSRTLLVASDMAYAAGTLSSYTGAALEPYDDTPPDNYRPDFQYDNSYVQKDVFINARSGLKAILFEKASTNEYIIAFGGTDGLDAKDWQANALHLGWNQWQAAKEVVLAWIRDARASGGTIHFTGQSLGGALAEFAAYDYLAGPGAIGLANNQAHVTVTTFNGLGSELKLREIYSNFNESLLNGVSESAAYRVRNDLVSRLGGGHSGIPVYLLDMTSDHRVPDVMSARDFQYFDLGPVEGHRIESGLYAHLSQPGVSYFTRAQQRPTDDGAFEMAQTERAMTLWDEVVNEKSLGPEDTYARLGAGLIAGAAFGGVDELDKFAHAVVSSLETSGLGLEAQSDDGWIRLRNLAFDRIRGKNLGLLVKGIGLFSTPLTLSAYATYLSFLTSGGSVKSSLIADAYSTILGVPHVGVIQDAARIAQFLRASVVIDDVVPSTPSQHAVFDPIGVGDGGLAAITSEASSSWLFDTEGYLLNREADRLRQQGLPASARAQQLIDYAQQVINWASEERQSISGIDASYAALMDADTRKFASVDVGNALAALSDTLVSPPLDHDDAFGSTSLTFAEYDAFHDALSRQVALADQQDDGLDPALQKVEASGEWVAISPLSTANPFDSPNFAGENAVLASGFVEGGVARYSVFIPYEAGQNGQRVKLALTGAGANNYEILSEGGVVPLAADGTFELSIPNGEREVVFGLRAAKDVDSDATLTLSAQLADVNDNPTHHQHAEVSLAIHGVVESAPSVGPTIAGSSQDDNRLGSAGHHEVLGDASNNRVQGLAGHDEIYGNGGDDIVESGPGADIAAGDDGNDAVYADSEITEAALRDYIATSATSQTAGTMPAQLLISQTEWLQGGLGNDTVVGTGNNDVLFGGGGKDLLVGGAGHDLIDGDDDYDAGDVTSLVIQPGVGSGTPFDANFSSVAIHGFAEDVGDADEIHAGSGDDYVFGQKGDDTIWADDGNDTVAGGADDDVMFGGRGNDRLTGDTYTKLVGDVSDIPAGDDYIDGGDGDDAIYGDGGADTLIGGAGDDSIRGNNDLAIGGVAILPEQDGDDYISGGDGRDILVGDGADDMILGGSGDDDLFGDSDSTPVALQGNDHLDGGAGRDYLRGYGGDDTLIGGDGVDQILGEAGDDYIDVGLDAGNAASGGDGNDILVGGVASNFLWGDAGDDRITSGGQLWGGTGKDTLTVEGGGQAMGGDDDDVLRVTFGSATLFGEAGDDHLTSAVSAAAQMDGGSGNDLIEGGDRADAAWGGDGADHLIGNGGDDQLQGGDGNDDLAGGDGDDIVFGDAGDDTLSGGAGRNYLLGGAGNDTYRVSEDVGEDIITDDEGANAMQFADDVDASQITFRRGVDPFGDDNYLILDGFGAGGRIVIKNGLSGAISDFRFADGTTLSAQQAHDRALTNTNQPTDQVATGSVTIGGSAGADAIAPLLAGETVTGGAGDDSLVGGNLGDSLDGGPGDDHLDGGAGDDTLRGGDGRDTYVFGRNSGNETIVENHVTIPATSETDTLQLAAGIVPADVRLIRDGNALVVMLDGGTTQARVQSQFLTTQLALVNGQWQQVPADNGIEQIRFADGTMWNAAQITARVQSGTPNAMTGTTGDDTFVVDSADDTVSEAPNAGNDTIQSTVSYALRPNVERLVLTGGALNSSAWATPSNAVSYLDGNDGNNTFDGPGSFYNAAGVLVTQAGGNINAFAVMSGGKGDDTYYLDYFKGGRVVEKPGEGIDTIYLPFGSGMFVMPDNVENVVDLSTGMDRQLDQPDSYTGNGLDNFLGYVGPMSRLSYVFDGGPGADTMQGSFGDDVYLVDNARDRVIDNGVYGGGGQASLHDKVMSSVTYELPANVEDLTLTGTAATDAWGNNLGNTLDGSRNAAVNTLHGGIGDDTYIVDGADRVVENPGEGFDTLQLHGTGTRIYLASDLPPNVDALALGDDLGASQLQGDARDNTLVGNASNNVIAGGAGDDDMRGGGGVDTYLFSAGFGHDVIRDDPPADGTQAPIEHIVFDSTINPEDVYFENGRLDVRGSGGDLLIRSRADVRFADGSTISDADLAALIRASKSSVPSAGADVLNGTPGNDVLSGLGGDDFLYGFGGNDALDGGAGADLLDGGSGDDVLSAGAGADRLIGSAGNDTLDGGDDIDDLRGGDGDDVLDGGDGNDRVFGDSGNDTLRGGLGADELHGGEGNDVVAAGADSSFGSLLYGEAGDDTLVGSPANDSLDGGPGDDVLSGGAGNDYLVGWDGNDTLQGGDGVDQLYGVAGDDVFDGGPGDDVLAGGPGDDTYVLKSGGGRDSVALYSDWYVAGEKAIVRVDAALHPNDVRVTFDTLSDGSRRFAVTANGGNDSIELEGRENAVFPVEVRFADGTVWDDATVLDKLYVKRGTTAADVLTADAWGSQLYGLAGDDTLTGGVGNDLLDGGSGRDAMSGGGGSDTYVVDDAGDMVTGGAGYDTVQTSVTYAAPATVEAVILTGAGNVNATGNSLANRLTGNSGDNALDGKAGGDTMTGGAGNDTYTVDSALDSVVERPGEGVDSVQSSVTYTLATDLENLTLIGTSAINGTGNANPNVLIGNAANNTLIGGGGNDQIDGGAGTDTMKGGAGNDTYTVERTTDVVTELAGEGIDGVLSSASFALGANVENLTLTGGAAINATGNTLANTLTGNTADNVLTGGTGADTMIGGAGNDTYIVDAIGDVVVENAAQGSDTVKSSVTYTLGVNVENLTLTGTAAINGTGNAFANTLTGNAAANVLDGAAGNDALIGGAGNDTYIVDGGDTVTEAASAGTDLVKSSVTWTLGANVENLTLMGSSAINGTGNGVANVITGNAASNVLDGAAGADTLIGGGGDDTLIVDNIGDIVTEAAGGGFDLVKTSVTHTLASNVEYLLLTGTGAINGTGNALDNWLQGNAAVNALDGGAGNDALSGAGGDDILKGGTGNDLVQGGSGNDVLNDTGGNNVLDGNAGNDTLAGAGGHDVFIGGAGSDTLTTGGGADVIAFDKGDGADVVNASVGTDDTLSIGGGIAYGDLALRKNGLDLILDASNGDQITLKSWYQGGVNNKSVVNLQVLVDAMAAFDPAGSDPLLNKRVVNFNFAGIVTAFDAALALNPGLTRWGLSNALSSNRLSGSDTAAVGGDFAYDYGHRAALTGIGATAGLADLAAVGFGTSAQALTPPGSLYSGTVRMQ